MSLCSWGQYNATIVSPGNRIQYGESIKWQRYSTSFAHFYFGNGTDSLIKYSIENYQSIQKRLERSSGLKARGIANVIIYPSASKFLETNIGSNFPRQYSFPTVILNGGGRIVLAFEGSYESYTRQLSVALLRNLWEQNISNNGALNTINYIRPELSWFREGFIHYLAEGFTLQENDSLFCLLQNDTLTNIDALLRHSKSEHQLLLAKGFCWFLKQHYRDDALKQIVFQLKQKKSLETAARLVTKRNWHELQMVYVAFLKHIYALPESNFKQEHNSTNKVTRKNNGDIAMLYQTDSNWFVFAKIKNDKRSIFLQANEKQKLLQSFQLPLWLEHRLSNYPFVDYSNKKLFILNLEKGRHLVTIYNRSGHKIRKVQLPAGIEGIVDFKVKNENQWLLTAYTKGRSDLISFNPQTLAVKAITNDLADNIGLNIDTKHPESLRYRSGFPHTLNADSSELNNAKVYGLYEKQSDSPNAKEILLSSDVTAFENMLEQFSNHNQSKPLSQHYWLQSYLKERKTADSLQTDLQMRKQQEKTDPGFLNGLFSKMNKPEQDTANESFYQKRNVKPYLIQLSNLWVNASVNNDYFINRLQPYQAQLGIYKFPEIGGMLTGGYADIFENHEFNAGYKMPAGTEGSDFFFRYKNKKQRLDWNVLYHRKVESLQPNAVNQWMDELGRPYPPTAKIKSYYYEAGFTYPISFFSKIDFSAALRNNKTVFLSTDKYSLEYMALKDLWNINTLSYTFNNIKVDKSNRMMLRGVRYRANLDGILGVGKQNKNQFSYGITQRINWYQPLYKWLNWHNHISMGYSGGSEYILYNFGGMDNNVITKVDSNAVFEQSAPYVFQQLITPLRGFQQNTMWGNAYGLINTEVFAQVFGGMINTTTKFQFINLIQVGAFADLAYSRATWNSNADWQRRNSFGLSLKTLLANYPIRVDVAFPYNLNQKPMIHLSLKL